MFKKSRRKIVAAIMAVLVVLWVGLLGVIYTFSYFEMKTQNEQMIKAHTEMYNLPKHANKKLKNELQAQKEAAESDKKKEPKNKPKNNSTSDEPKVKKEFVESSSFKLSTFYTVAVSFGGEILDIKNEQPAVITDDELKILAQNVIESGEDKGRENNLAFYKADKDGYTIVTFMDNTVINESAWTLFRYTLIFGSVAIVLFFFLSMYLARKIVNPLEESYQKQKQFISDAGHELKTPVSVVSANAELLSREVGDNQWLQNIQYENQRMGLLVGQLLELARTENVTHQTEYLDFSRLVAGEALPFESVAFEKGLALSANITPNITVVGNNPQLKQLVSILLDNAIRHSEDNGEIYLSLSKDRGVAKLSVINKGEAIPKDEREQIFERFYRRDDVRNSEDKHYGLGLAIAKAIATSHKGNIEVLCYNGFVEFRVKLPASKEN